MLQRRQEDNTRKVTRRIDVGRERRKFPELSLEQGMVRIRHGVKTIMGSGDEKGGYVPKADLKEFIERGRALWLD